MKARYGILCLFFLSLVSCFKKEKPISLPPGSSQVASVFLGNNYENVLYFDLGTNTYQQGQLADWDICFEASKDGHGIFMNTGVNSILIRTDVYHLNEPQTWDTIDILRLDTLTDNPDGKPEHSAIGDWEHQDVRIVGADTSYNVYLLQLPYFQGANRYRRLQFMNCSATSYRFKVADLYDTKGTVIEIQKDPNHNFVYYSFNNGGHVVTGAEPGRNSWDIEFARYKEILAIVGPYPVNGVLSNTNNVVTARDSITPFSDIDAGKIATYQFTSNRNGIGYDWKTFDLNNGYSVNSKINYIIRDTDGQYYKLRFLDFYNDQKQKGYPKFEFERIK